MSSSPQSTVNGVPEMFEPMPLNISALAQCAVLTTASGLACVLYLGVHDVMGLFEARDDSVPSPR